MAGGALVKMEMIIWFARNLPSITIDISQIIDQGQRNGAIYLRVYWLQQSRPQLQPKPPSLN